MSFIEPEQNTSMNDLITPIREETSQSPELKKMKAQTAKKGEDLELGLKMVEAKYMTQ
jgi:hypothetical protein